MKWLTNKICKLLKIRSLHISLHASVHLQRIFSWKFYDHEYLSVEFENADHLLLITYT